MEPARQLNSGQTPTKRTPPYAAASTVTTASSAIKAGAHASIGTDSYVRRDIGLVGLITRRSHVQFRSPLLVRLQRRALRVAHATLESGRAARTIAGKTPTTTQSTLAAAQHTLTVAEQTLAHAASLDRKVGPVP
jgi:hypothetical protein